MPYTVQVTARDAAGHTAVRSVPITQWPRLGMDANPGDWAATVAAFPGVRYTRDFGKDGADADVLPELSAHGTGKASGAPAGCIIHYGWKDDVEQLAGWLDGLTRQIYLSWYHEPMGNLTPSAYRATAVRVTQIVAAHPKRNLVLGHGPVVTRYWLEPTQGNGDPADWWYDGATMFGCDCYNGSSAFYRTAQQMFGPGLAAARRFGVPLIVPEYGMERIPSDTSGAGRAQAMRDHIAFLRAQPDVLAVGWWNIGGDEITGLEPEQTTWRQLLQEA